MNVPPDDGSARLRWGIYWVLIAVAAGGILGRILSVNSIDYLRLEQHLKRDRTDWQKQRPFLSANDRSRWATVRALVEHGTYAIDEIVSQPNWDTIDIVKHDENGLPAPEPEAGHIYSSKPTLLPTIMAGEYWLILKLTGLSLGEHPFAVGRIMLVTFNLLPLLIYFVIWGKLADRYAATDFGRIFTMGCITFGTFLSTFAITINNHLPAAVTALIAAYAGLRITVDGERRLRYFAIVGFFTALTAANELPALAFCVALLALVAWHAPRQTLLVSLPAALVVAAAACGTNYAAHHTLSIPYAHREEGDWYDFKYIRNGKVIDSYWSNRGARSAIDQGEPSIPRYAMHVLVGHHGIFSLTPIWILSLIGLPIVCFGANRGLRQWGLLIAAVSIACLLFYIVFRDVTDRNYGGMSSGFRWAFWMAPLWLIAMLPVADAAGQRRWSQFLAAVLLGLSTMSVAYPTWNPWTHPWIWDAIEQWPF